MVSNIFSNARFPYRFFPDIRGVLSKRRDLLAELSKTLGYCLDGLVFLILFGNKNKTLSFHNSKNPFIKIYRKSRFKHMIKYLRKDSILDFNKILLPYTQKEEDILSYLAVFEDTFEIYLNYKDNYDYKIVDRIDRYLPEGVYCYLGPNNEDITVKKGMNVIDAGAWIGDFSAYSSKKGANVFAFEPSPKNFNILKKTAKLNKNIKAFNLGLSDKSETLNFNASNEGSFCDSITKEGKTKINVISLDEWSKKNKVKIDFIKADIEGYERNMLKGAKNVLKKDKPILSICTYHLKDDPKVLEKIILDSNPKYKVIQRKKKLFAYVPN